MIQCPHCSHSVPDWSKSCQFCQGDVSGVARPKQADLRKGTHNEQPKWIRPALHVVSAYYILSGLRGLASGVPLLSVKDGAPTATGLLLATGLVMIVVGVLSSLVGVGLLNKLEMARSAANPLSVLRILASGLILVGAALAGGVDTGQTILNVVDILASAGMIYLIRETD